MPSHPAPAPSLRERKRAAAKARVVDVAIALFSQRGYNAVSVAEICEAADVAQRSFFRYFPAKEDVLLEPVREMADRMQAALATAPAELSDGEALHAALRELASYTLDNWERLAPYYRVVKDTTAVRASPLVQLADRERAMAAELLARRRGPAADDDDDAGALDWRTRLLVARGVAGYRIWLDDLRAGGLEDPLAHLDEILAAA